MKNRRRYERFQANSEAGYSATKGLVSLNSTGNIKNVSNNGICMVLSRLIKRGDQLLLELGMDEKARRIPVLAETIWTKPAANSIYNLGGLEFRWVLSNLALEDYVGHTKNI